MVLSSFTLVRTRSGLTGFRPPVHFILSTYVVHLPTYVTHLPTYVVQLPTYTCACPPEAGGRLESGLVSTAPAQRSTDRHLVSTAAPAPMAEVTTLEQAPYTTIEHTKHTQPYKQQQDQEQLQIMDTSCQHLVSTTAPAPTAEVTTCYFFRSSSKYNKRTHGI